MSGIYIKGMEMPTRCIACRMNYDSCACILTGSRFYKYNTEFDPGEERLPDCPLIPVPDHGDLIDYDFCMENYELLHDDDGNPVYAVRMRDINKAPTIIPADKEVEG